MDLTPIKDFVHNAYDQVGKYKIELILAPDLLITREYEVDFLKWDSVLFGNEDELDKVP